MTVESLHTCETWEFAYVDDYIAADDPLDDLKTMLVDMVGDVFSIEVERLRQPTRGQAPVALARQVGMYIAHVDCGMSLTEVGHLFDRDRTTVAHACRTVEQLRDKPGFDEALELLRTVVHILLYSGRPMHRGQRNGPRSPARAR